ncbi:MULTISPECIES: phosphatase PAP2 family protein [Leeuwenhoekiella]|jgi:membrane-associated phospholipid phosphatase|uniref:phosphatase PAP2 family protein n=1 Tax=Leeuwenhoekiella TaxID=283735 RepID=UPI000C596B16|nr:MULTISPECIES: phosphatase PAP2 family protein [Leeuwenhoekiella]MAO41903.1 phosphatase PAP2 family protein [Leeuwenhoekiella sp.]HBT08910.1 PAP2 family protein [Leeuwenhoekiella sp.]HCW65311.1 PAP2 family protein [Leeuwenhoekiella sp.]|tara:strand:- start:924 stop:1508 length:585 start_codon:yes stop_codon:yes gene_type:complete
MKIPFHHNIIRSSFLILFLGIQTFKLIAQDTSETLPQVGTTQKIGDVILFVLPVATAGTSLIKGDNQGVWQFTKGFVMTEALTYGLKLSINKTRPDLSNDNAFPSGHTSTVFHSAGYIHRRYGFKYSIPAYALAGFTAASRIDSKKHDIVDVLAGTAIGLGSNLLSTTEYQQKHMELSYTSFDGNHMLGFTYEF